MRRTSSWAGIPANKRNRASGTHPRTRTRLANDCTMVCLWLVVVRRCCGCTLLAPSLSLLVACGGSIGKRQRQLRARRGSGGAALPWHQRGASGGAVTSVSLRCLSGAFCSSAPKCNRWRWCAVCSVRWSCSGMAAGSTSHGTAPRRLVSPGACPASGLFAVETDCRAFPPPLACLRAAMRSRCPWRSRSVAGWCVCRIDVGRHPPCTALL